ncbi:Gfo/Idh/MocA family protein [Leuconostoc pseudomesenteroides]|uniref:Gfo/Idh/MocA family protein n=1 Tax=Leuconostoc pseudomesenteroides TaxID=33968 RepID=UPI0021A5D410|nr:Gfo/Idh/MocA family oxidoreductase [Leuconostoc pseudomesenteroides]MCT4380110.1 gfo/Idh/MocA family oxidoreductase [Leuconostoc pseudomesenteroides]
MINVGVLAPSEIAFRRFMPALSAIENAHFVGVGVYSAEERFGQNNYSDNYIFSKIKDENIKANKFTNDYGGRVFHSFQELIESPDIDAVYLPLPPAAHAFWAKKVLESGKHLLMEKPFTTRVADTEELLTLAKKSNLAVHENYMFVYHKQIKEIKRIIDNKELGKIRLFRITFGFPMRAKDDFRYDKSQGGGSLIDAGGYTIKFAQCLLGPDVKVQASKLNFENSFDVDLFGSATLIGKSGITAQLSFGMDNEYRNELEVWGSNGLLISDRVLTAPPGFYPKATLRKQGVDTAIKLSEDDAFKKSIESFFEAIEDENVRNAKYTEIMNQATLVDTAFSIGDTSFK